jgi:asparagine synthase (glutamine-hydrolysing)
MAARLRHDYTWFEEDHYVDEALGVSLGRVALKAIYPGSQPATNEDESIVAVMDGEIYDYDKHHEKLVSRGHKFVGNSQAELLIHGCEEGGMRFFEGLHGKFAAALWDKKRQRLILATDRFGMKPLYYAKVAGGLLFASEIKAILVERSISRSTNLRGIAQFFTFGQLLGEDTFFKEINLVPAAGWLVWDMDSNRLSIDRYWRLKSEAAPQEFNEQDHLARIQEAFRAAIQRSIVGTKRLGLSLSGGLDSRTLLAAIPPNRSLTTVSMGVDGGIDHRCAEQMARLANRPHHRCVLNEAFLGQFEQHLNRMVRLTDGHYLCQCIVMPTLPVYRDLGIQILLRGHAGELMHIRKAYNFSLDRRALAIRDETDLKAWLFQHLQAYMLEGTGSSLFAPAYRQHIEGLAKESLEGCLSESAETSPALHRIWHLFISQRLRRETAMSLVEFGSFVETRIPFLDNELVGALLTAPPEMKLGETIQSHLLRHSMPALLHVINVNTGTRLEAGQVARAFGRARLKVLAKLRFKGYQPYERLGLWLRRELRPLVQKLLLSEPCLERGIFDPDAVKAVVENHSAGLRNHTYLILALMIFETCNRQFLDGLDFRASALASQEVA